MNWTEDDHPTPEQERETWAREECQRRGIDPDEICADGGVEAWQVVAQESLEDRLKPALLRALIGFWSDVDEVRQRADINVGAKTRAWRALKELVADGLAECDGQEQYRLTDKGREVRTALPKAA